MGKPLLVIGMERGVTPADATLLKDQLEGLYPELEVVVIAACAAVAVVTADERSP